MRVMCAFTLLFCFLFSSVMAQTDKKILITKTTEYQNSPPMFRSNGMMTGGGGSKTTYVFFLDGEKGRYEVSYLGENLRSILDPKSGAIGQMRIYSGKRAGELLGAVGFMAFAILSFTSGMEETGETSTSVNEYGYTETTNVKRVTSLGYTYLGLSGVSAIGGLYCFFSKGNNLKKAVRLHNEYIESGRKTSLLLDFEF